MTMTETRPRYGDPLSATHRIDPDKLLELCRQRHREGQVTLSWPTMIQIINQLREQNPVAPGGAIPVTPEMIDAAAYAYMPFGDMRAAVEAALAEINH